MIVSGFVVFGDWPPMATLAGASLVAACGVWLAIARAAGAVNWRRRLFRRAALLETRQVFQRLGAENCPFFAAAGFPARRKELKAQRKEFKTKAQGNQNPSQGNEIRRKEMKMQNQVFQ